MEEEHSLCSTSFVFIMDERHIPPKVSRPPPSTLSAALITDTAFNKLPSSGSDQRLHEAAGVWVQPSIDWVVFVAAGELAHYFLSLRLEV